nr:hypothetical protein [Parachlamydiaceae bacterium]
MRSYYAHLSTTDPVEATAVVPKPVFRSSAIFPVFQSAGISSRILFLGYWLLKRNISQISAIISLRTLSGELIGRLYQEIKEAKSYSYELKDFLSRAKINPSEEFSGSIEIELYSGLGLVFPYPAVVINYYGPNFSSVVHTAQRIYNDYDDMQKNSQTEVPESGFNLYADANLEPFISIINGPMGVPAAYIDFEFFNSTGERLQHRKELGLLLPYQTRVIYPARECGLQEFLRGFVGFCRVHFNVSWIFPRLLVGNLCHEPKALAITHTYYDCIAAVSDSDYWQVPDPRWYPAALMVPLRSVDTYFTNLYFYPIYSSSKLAIDVEIYRSDGSLAGHKKSALIVVSPGQELKILKLKDLLEELGIDKQEDLSAKIMATALEESRVPARIKLGLDLGNEHLGLPCNICTNLQPYNPRYEGKRSSFKWAPLL